MNELQIFKSNEFGEVRVLEKDGQVWFVGKDVAEILGYSKPLNAISQHVEEDDSLKQGIADSLGREQQTITINESGLYALIFGSQLPKAKEFKRWVTSEVIPSIRKHGGYITNQKNLSSEEILANAVLVAQNVIKEKDMLLEEQRPKVLFAEAVENSNDVILVKEMATIITQRGFKIGQNQLFDFLRQNEYLCKKEGDMYNLPTKRYEHLFRVTKRIIQGTNGSKVRNTPKVTGKGQMYFIKKFVEFSVQGLTVKDLLRKEVV